jgi:hypothetical protein
LLLLLTGSGRDDLVFCFPAGAAFVSGLAFVAFVVAGASLDRRVVRRIAGKEGSLVPIASVPFFGSAGPGPLGLRLGFILD